MKVDKKKILKLVNALEERVEQVSLTIDDFDRMEEENGGLSDYLCGYRVGLKLAHSELETMLQLIKRCVQEGQPDKLSKERNEE